ncbi:hypothetical protein [Acanthopleuribacter pedis]|uniref:Uncharacterized protein n=1 Tax=Acanthopleuribacter pedis TaxID=442870 RepID=A0A8J7U3S9_9BACT|nr:hypothetical protein [Acanthopleuribacter pedis]MBO1319922.1 hypothetical protein [Acanthopleuribacter pedis]
MKKMITALMVLMMAGTVFANETRFFNFELVANTDGDEPTTIKLNIPVNTIKAFDTQFDQFLVQTHATDEFNTFTELWQEIRNVGPNDYVEINQGDETIFVSTTDTDIIVDITSTEEGKIKITIPMDLVDYLTEIQSGEDLMDVIDSLEGRELLRIEGDKINGRLTIK